MRRHKNRGEVGPRPFAPIAVTSLFQSTSPLLKTRQRKNLTDGSIPLHSVFSEVTAKAYHEEGKKQALWLTLDNNPQRKLTGASTGHVSHHYKAFDQIVKRDREERS